MSNIINKLSDLYKNMTAQTALIGFSDIIDIIILAVLLFYLYKFIRGRRAGKLMAGVFIILLTLMLSEIFEMHAIKFILQNFFQVGIIALLVVFQPELRSALEKMGARPLRGLMGLGEGRGNTAQIGRCVENICSAVTDMSHSRTGAIIVVERATKLGDYIKSGSTVNADINAMLIKNIFYDKAPLHDGAIIIRDLRLYAAGCFLPVSTNDDVIKELGSRHRAAVGISEVSDALVIVVSEETGVVSIAADGSLDRNYDYIRLREALTAGISPKNAAHKHKEKSDITEDGDDHK